MSTLPHNLGTDSHYNLSVHHIYLVHLLEKYNFLYVLDLLAYNIVLSKQPISFYNKYEIHEPLRSF